MSEQLMQISKTFHWEMSHRLPYHAGDCRNIHGHSYKLRLDIIGLPDERGMVIDYFEIERKVSKHLQKFDHAFICDIKDTSMLEFLNRMDFKYVVIKEFTTAENVALYLLNELAPEFREMPNIRKMRLRLYETNDAFAETELVIKE
jgi:6-pyruvoyltetrahydropterin/6-carboxytetrahydropterin synthase